MMRSALRSYCLFALAGITLTLVSCEKEVHINLASAPPQVVVDGAIEPGLPPYVFLTSTIGFFNQVSLQTVQNSFLHGAAITVSDGSKTVQLKEYAFDTAGGTGNYYVYTIDTTNPANLMLGQTNSFYTLTVKYNGQTYTAVSKIPDVKGVDSLWFDKPTLDNSKTPTNALQLYANYTDPDTPGNYVRYFTKRNSEQFYPVGIFTDEVVNGKRITDIGLYAGYESTPNSNNDSLRYFYPGDTVVVKWSEIDKGVYTFWNTYEFANAAIGNPFASPINVQTNMSGGALGIWAGYGSIFYTIVAPR